MSGIFNNYQFQTPQSLPAATQTKTVILARRKPITAGIINRFLGGGVPGVGTGPNLLDAYTRNVLQTLYSQEAALGQSITNFNNGITGSLRGLSQDIGVGLGAAAESITDALKPVSTSLGSVLGTLTGVLKDPLGALELVPRAVGSLIERVNPTFAAQLEGSFKKIKLDTLANLPRQIVGSLSNLVSIVDGIITLPIILLSDLYNGLLEVLDLIADIIDSFINQIIGFFWNILFGEDGLLPIGDLLEFLEALSELASEIGGLTTLFFGPNTIAGYAFNVQSYASMLGGYLTNPRSALLTFLPSSITKPLSQGLYVLRNPEFFISQIMPPEINALLGRLGDLAGFGYNGNMGYGLQNLLNNLRGGVLSSILNNFKNQYPILNGILSPWGNSALSNGTSFPPGLKGFRGNPNVVVDSQGIPQPQQMPQRPIPTGP